MAFWTPLQEIWVRELPVESEEISGAANSIASATTSTVIVAVASSYISSAALTAVMTALPITFAVATPSDVIDIIASSLLL